MRPKNTKIHNRQFFMPEHLNKKGTLFGGVLMAEIDKIAAMAAELYSGGTVVTAAVDHLSFDRPIDINDHIIFKAMINYVGNSSMEVGVRVEAQNPENKKVEHYCTAYLTFVSLDEEGNPRQVPKLSPKSKKEKRRWKKAEDRMKIRRIHRKKQKKTNT